MKNIEENAPDDVFRVLVANKCDLHGRLVVSTEHGKRLAAEFHVDYFETSAQSNSNEAISQMFCFIAEKLLERKQSTSTLPAIKLDQLNDSTQSIYQKLTGCC
jgi:GTPase SAR1 family protein